MIKMVMIGGENTATLFVLCLGPLTSELSWGKWMWMMQLKQNLKQNNSF